jgi:leucine dehydrogenase
MEIIEKDFSGEHERVLFARDEAIGYRAIIAIHSTLLGPAVGGTRFWNYASEDQALEDALRLSRGMTYKNALPGLALGGGKSVIIGDHKLADREAIFRAHGRFVESLGGQYITAEDVGTSPLDMEIVRRETMHVGGLLDRSGDPSPVTAQGVFRAIQASAKYLWNRSELDGVKVALQGCGHVGNHLAMSLARAGAKLTLSDVDPDKVSSLASELGATAVEPERIFSVDADIFAPCALGGILDDRTIPQLKAKIVAGAANNQLAEARHGEMLEERGILYAPDYAANAGGIFNGCIELLGWQPEQAAKKVDEIYDTILDIFHTAKAAGITPPQAADRIAENHLRSAVANSFS